MGLFDPLTLTQSARFMVIMATTYEPCGIWASLTCWPYDQVSLDNWPIPWAIVWYK